MPTSSRSLSLVTSSLWALASLSLCCCTCCTTSACCSVTRSNLTCVCTDTASSSARERRRCSIEASKRLCKPASFLRDSAFSLLTSTSSSQLCLPAADSVQTRQSAGPTSEELCWSLTTQQRKAHDLVCSDYSTRAVCVCLWPYVKCMMTCHNCNS